MGVVIPQVVTEDRASEAQFIDGSLRFDRSKTHIIKNTFSSAGNRKTWTLSFWHKITDTSNSYNIFTASRGSSTRPTFEVAHNYGSSGNLVLSQYNGSGYDIGVKVDGLYRDIGAWYHFVVVVDTTQSTDSNRVKAYINGIQRNVTASAGGSVWPSLNADLEIGNNVLHNISANAYGDGNPMNGYVSNFYYINGQALDPSYFGYTDPLTNTWRPKKFGGSYNGGTLLNYNNNTGYPVYSNQGSTQGQLSSNPISNAFDSNASTYCDMTYLNGQWSKLTFGQAITNVTNVTIGYDGEGDIGYNGSITNTTVGYTASRQTITLYSGSPITLTDLYFVTQAGNGVCRLYDITITTSTVSATELTYYGANSFYLPLDGNTPIGQDRSGNNNNWTPVNFGGSNTIEKATGALPILNTDGGGKVARVGVRTDSNASSLVLALPLVGIRSDFSNRINSGTSNKAITANGNAAASSAQSNFYGGSFYFDGVGDYLETSTSNDFVVGTGDFTLEGWFNVDASQTTNARLFGQNINNSSNWDCYIDGTSGTNGIYMHGNAVNLGMSFPSAGNWHHFCIVRSSGVLYSFMNGVLRNTQAYTNSVGVNNFGFRIGEIGPNGGSGYTLKGYVQDFRLYKGLAKYTQNFIPASTDPDILPDTPSGVAYSSNVALVPSTDGSLSNRTSSRLEIGSSADFDFTGVDWTIETFFNNTSTSSVRMWYFGNNAQNIQWSGTNQLLYYNGSNTYTFGSLALNTWYHLALVNQSGTVTAYINGVAQTTFPAGSTTTRTLTIGDFAGGTADNNWIGFISNFHIVKGTALYTSNFTPPTAPITSVANTKLLCCKSNSSATAADVTPGTITANGNATASNFNPFTVNINTQRGQESGYCTWNPLEKAANMTLSNGNLDSSQSSGDQNTGGTVAVNSGKWYWEVAIISHTGEHRIGAIKQQFVKTDSPFSTFLGGGSNGYSYASGGFKSNANSNSATGYSTFTSGDVISVALDMDNGKIYFSKNGIWQEGGNPSAGTNAAYSSLSGYFVPAIYTPTANLSANFGQKPFKFPPPAGFQPLALANTPRPTIVRPDQYVGIVTYTGNGSALAVNTGFQPDLVWCKIRSPNAYNHTILDSVRGFTKSLSSSMTVQEYTEPTGPVAITRNGFTLNGDVTYVGSVNQNGSSYVAWAWKAGGNSNTYNINDVGYATASAAGLTAGTITPTGASVNTKSGFSIITYTGNGTSGTLSHGLGNAPGMVIIKSRSDGTTNWIVWHKGLTSGYYILLSSSGAQTNTSASQYFGNTSTTVDPSSTVITLGGANAVNNNSPATYVAYSWAEIPGFSKFGTYTGNGSTDGPVVITGMRVRYLLVKRTDTTASWEIYDAARNPNNLVTQLLEANAAGAEFTGTTNYVVDFLSNGFKIRGTFADLNASGGTYIYAAFAETPSFNLYGGQANAR